MCDHRVFCNVRHTSVAVGMIVPLSVREIANQGGTADIMFVLDRYFYNAVKVFLYPDTGGHHVYSIKTMAVRDLMQKRTVGDARPYK